MELRNDHNVYILGAGFSKEAGLPLISDFLLRMRDSHEWLITAGRQTEADAVQRVLEFRLKAASAAYYVNSDLENIEELFSLASASVGDMDIAIRIAIAATIDFIRSTNPPEQCRMFVTNSTAMASLFVSPGAKGGPAKHPGWAKPAGELDTLNPGRSGPFSITRYAFHVARLLGMFLNGAPQGQNTFITFNYDTVLEDALNDLDIRFDYEFGSGWGSTSKPAQSTNHAIPLFKLHGSVNWGKNGSSGVLRAELRMFSTSAEMLADKAQPVLVPPTWKKTFGGPLEGVWDGAINKLATATRIIIIGFSMPPTDMHFKYLMAAGLQNNVSLRQILFVNPDQDNQLRHRAETLLRKSYIAFAKTGLGGCTNFQTGHVHLMGRSAELGLSCELHSVL